MRVAVTHSYGGAAGGAEGGRGGGRDGGGSVGKGGGGATGGGGGSGGEGHTKPCCADTHGRGRWKGMYSQRRVSFPKRTYELAHASGSSIGTSKHHTGGDCFLKLTMPAVQSHGGGGGGLGGMGGGRCGAGGGAGEGVHGGGSGTGGLGFAEGGGGGGGGGDGNGDGGGRGGWHSSAGRVLHTGWWCSTLCLHAEREVFQCTA